MGEVGILALCYAAALHRQGELSRPAAAALRAWCPTLSEQGFPAAVARVSGELFGTAAAAPGAPPRPPPQAVKDEVRKKAAGDLALLAGLDAVDALVREARRAPRRMKRPVARRPTGPDDLDR